MCVCVCASPRTSPATLPLQGPGAGGHHERLSFYESVFSEQKLSFTSATIGPRLGDQARSDARAGAKGRVGEWESVNSVYPVYTQ